MWACMLKWTWEQRFPKIIRVAKYFNYTEWWDLCVDSKRHVCLFMLDLKIRNKRKNLHLKPHDFVHLTRPSTLSL